MMQIRGNLIGLGGSREVRVTVEFGRLDAASAANAVQNRFGGTIRSDGPHRLSVSGTEFGKFKIELDRDWIDRSAGGHFVLDKAKERPDDISRDLVPTEVITPPMPADRLCEIDVLVHDLVRLSAQGTRDGPLNRFCAHMTPSLDPADLTPGSILRVLQAFLLEAPAQCVAPDIDPIRTLPPLVDPFPSDYVDRVLDPDYAPTFAALIDDYLRSNATGDRELDMLPLFSLVDRARVQLAVPDSRISARAVFHWRLPNADFEHPGWSVAGQWSRRLRIERLSLDVADLADRLAHRAHLAAAEDQRLAARS